MASIQSVRDEVAWSLSPTPSARRFGNAVFASQPQKWLTERFAYLPQVRRFFDENLPGLAQASGNFHNS
jgi:hypothetical protein